MPTPATMTRSAMAVSLPVVTPCVDEGEAIADTRRVVLSVERVQVAPALEQILGRRRLVSLEPDHARAFPAQARETTAPGLEQLAARRAALAGQRQHQW